METKNKTISILGCGWLGLPLGQRLRKVGYSIKGSTTRMGRIELLNQKGISPFQLSLENVQQVPDSFLASDVLILATPSKNLVGYEQLLEKVKQSPIKKVLFISSTSVYPNTNETVYETAPTNSSPLTAIEQLWLNCPTIDSTVIRFAGLYGYERKPGNFIRDGILKNPNGYVNLIHRDDCIGIIEQVIEQNCWNTLLNACCDDHPLRKDFYLQEVLKMGKPTLRFNSEEPAVFKIVSNEKLKKLLNYEFQFNRLIDRVSQFE